MKNKKKKIKNKYFQIITLKNQNQLSKKNCLDNICFQKIIKTSFVI